MPKFLKELRDIKVVVVGDGTVGKTSLLIQYCKNRFNPKYTPTIFDNMLAQRKYQDRSIGLNLWDTAGQEDYDALRPLSYPETDVFVLCFDVMSRTSFKNVKLKWIEEVKQYCPEANLVLCGTKTDLRDDVEAIKKMKEKGITSVSVDEANQMSKQLKCYGFVETSAKLRKGVDELFEMCLDSCFKSKKRHRVCVIL